MTEKDLILQNYFKITSAETDMYGRIRLGALANLLIQSATNSADKLGFGYKNIREQKLFWVLSRMTIEIYHPIKWYDEIVVETWPKDLDKILYIRDFTIKDKAGKILAKATSGWLAIDLDKKRPKIIEDLHAEAFYLLKNKHALSTFPEKLPPVKDGALFKTQAQYFDIDVNKHVTATRYIDWMMDTVPQKIHELSFPKKLTINFIKETWIHDDIEILQQILAKCINFEAKTSKNQNAIFRAKIEF